MYMRLEGEIPVFTLDKEGLLSVQEIKAILFFAKQLCQWVQQAQMVI